MLFEKRERWDGGCCVCPIEVDGWENSEGRCCDWFCVLVLPLAELATQNMLGMLSMLVPIDTREKY